MKKKLLKQTIQASYTNNQLDEEKINKIIKFLNRKELKEYIKGLKMKEKQMTITIESPTDDAKTKYPNVFKSIFPEKKLIFRQDPSLLLGIRITNNDLVTDLSFQNSLRQIQEFIEETI